MQSWEPEAGIPVMPENAGLQADFVPEELMARIMKSRFEVINCLAVKQMLFKM
jgi:hypothetical protein